MKPFAFMFFLGLHKVASVTHSLKYIYTGFSGLPNLPDYVSVGLVDNVLISHCDSNTKRNVPKQKWMENFSDDPQYWTEETESCLVSQQIFKSNIEIAKLRFSQTRGIHIYQRMYGCDWDNETGEVNGYEQFGYDGEDLIAFDLKKEKWIAAKRQAFPTQNQWNKNKDYKAFNKNYLTEICPKWLKKYVNYGRSSLMRTVLPSVSLLQKTSSSPISCHATGFYPDRAVMFWRKDGEEIHEGVEHGEILPNHDGTFQMSVDLDVSSVPEEDWRRYHCVFNLSGLEEKITTELDKNKILTNERSVIPVMIAIAAVAVLFLVCVIGVFVYKRKTAKQRPSPENSKEVLETLSPYAYA